MLTDDQITKFQQIWKKKFNEDISREQALSYGLNLIRLLQVVCRDPKEF